MTLHNDSFDRLLLLRFFTPFHHSQPENPSTSTSMRTLQSRLHHPKPTGAPTWKVISFGRLRPTSAGHGSEQCWKRYVWVMRGTSNSRLLWLWYLWLFMDIVVYGYLWLWLSMVIYGLFLVTMKWTHEIFQQSTVNRKKSNCYIYIYIGFYYERDGGLK